MAAMQDKGKGKGKGGKDSEGKGGGKGHLLPRTRLSAEKFTGTVAAWKGNYGWIKPSEEIPHEKAALHNGSLFVSRDDLVGTEALEAGAPCEFHITEDDNGLGAEEVVQTGAGDPNAKGAKGGKGKSWGEKGDAKGGKGWNSWGGDSWGGKGLWGKDSWGGKGSWGGKDSWGQDAWGGKGGAKSWAPAGGKGVMSSYGKSDKGGKKGEKGKSGGKGHMLPRTRITAEKFTGTVEAWKGKYGWIAPSEEISHEKAGSHNGKLFVSKDDLQGVEELTPGSAVAFHVFEDSSGLGADEVAVTG